ncbi:hypothetical protein VO56_02045 [Mycoplasmopsis gallinacea]|uniref:NERD domain-containing protein n=1 Tax=Mycoplasmopsis gallinacea TaxID=29556 RepID=A0A0D5ZK58_9BACT|nr:hypothetical protein VO56_02045 [Mycoplasmopsis gallinacea]
MDSTNNNIEVANSEVTAEKTKQTAQAVSKVIDSNAVIALIVIFTLIILAAFGYFLYWYLWKYRKNLNIGYQFEEKINNLIKNNLDIPELKFKEGGMYSYDSKMYELDSFIISDKFAIVLEYKAYQGTINGDGNKPDLYLSNSKSKKIKIKNPILQNEKHLAHFQKTIGKKFPKVSIIVFPKDTKIDVSNVQKHVLLVTEDKLIEKIKLIHKQSDKLPVVFDTQDVMNLLDSMRINSQKEHRRFKKMIGK